jgi:hypothetical protein
MELFYLLEGSSYDHKGSFYFLLPQYIRPNVWVGEPSWQLGPGYIRDVHMWAMS